MTDIESKIRKKLQKATFNPPEILQGEVTEVDEDAMTCTVKHGAVEYYDVQLRAVVNDEDYVVEIPKVGTVVVYGMIEYGNKYMILKVGTADKILVKKNQLEVQISSSGIAVKNKGENLSSLIQDLITEIGKITVTTSSGPSGQPVNLPAFKKIGLKFKKVLKDVE